MRLPGSLVVVWGAGTPPGQNHVAMLVVQSAVGLSCSAPACCCKMLLGRARACLAGTAWQVIRCDPAVLPVGRAAGTERLCSSLKAWLNL